MRVCLLTPEFRPTWGGVGTYTYNLARALRDRAEVHVVTSGTGPEPSAHLEGVQLHPIHAEGPSPDRMGFAFQMAAYRRLPGLAREHGFDLIHSNHAYMSDLLLRFRHLPVRPVLTVHTTLGTQIEGTLRARGAVPLDSRERTIARWRYLFRGIERRYLRRTPAMIFVSRYVRDHALSRYRLAPRRSAVIPNGVDVRGLTRHGGTDPRPTSDGERTLLFAGRLLALKGIDTLLRALVHVDARVRVKLAGPGDAGPWRAFAKHVGLDSGRAEFLGPVPHGRMARLYEGADAVVLPSFSESCPMVALEAMASATPLIAASAGGVREIVRDGVTGWLFPPGDVQGLADRIHAVLSDPHEARAVAARARTWVRENASLELMADRTFRFFEDVCGGAS